MNAMLAVRRAILLAGVAWSAFGSAESPAPLRDVAEVGLGSDFTCALSDRGVASCWGSNEFGQLGLRDGALSDRPTPVPVTSAGSGLSRLGVGAFHACAITSNGGVKCWGRDLYGALGDGPEDHGPTAVDVVGLSGPVTKLSAGVAHTCALIANGTVQCWGYNALGQLGDGTFVEERSTPVDVVGLGGTAIGIEAGDGHTCAILSDGSLKCWGENVGGQLGDGTTVNRSQPVQVQGLPGAVTMVAAGSRATCALVTHNGSIHCWGPQYPLGAFDGDRLFANPYPGFESGYVAIDAGTFHFCALSSTNAIKCFGDGFNGQFGTGPIDGSLNTDAAVGLAPNITQVAAGGRHTCARSAEGGLQCWGLNTSGQLGIDSFTRRLVPTQVVGLTTGVSAVAAGGTHSCALTSAGGVKCWGSNNQDTIDASQRVRLTPVDVVGLQSGVRALATGNDHSCVIDAQRRVLCWGGNYDGRLGNGETLNSGVPVEVLGLGGVGATAIAVGESHACALLEGGAVKCWGTNQFGQIGDGTNQDRRTAVDVVGLDSGVRAISAGYYFSCAITATNGLKCWGENTSGQLGDGSNTHRNTPTDVVGLSSRVQAVASGDQHGCAIVLGGAVTCWGAHFYGLLLGDASSVDRNVPGDIPALNQGVVELTLGAYQSCVRLDRGAVKCWGVNPIGDNTELARPTPTDVVGLGRGVTDVDAGFGGHICAVVDGAAKCWGGNSGGQIGDGSTHGVPVPQTVVSDELTRRIDAVAPVANAASTAAQSDASGRFVVFQSRASNLDAGDTNGALDIFRTDRQSGASVRVSVDNADAQIAGDSIEPSISADGNFVVFVAPDAAVGAVMGETKAQRDARRKSNHHAVYLRNMLTGTTQRMGNGMAGGVGTAPQIAPQSTAVVFTSNLPSSGSTPGPANAYHVPLTQSTAPTPGSPPAITLTPGATRCVTCKVVDANGADTSTDTNGDSRNAVVSADGRYVVVETQAKNAIAAAPSPCTGSSADILLRDMLSGTMQRMSPPPGTSSANCGVAGSTAPSIDYAGTTIAFQSDQPLAGSDGNGLSDIYLISPSTGTAPVLVSTPSDGTDGNGPSTAPTVSGDGSSVAFVSSAQNLDLSFPDNNDRSDVHAVLVGTAGVARLSLSSTGAESDAASERPALNFDGTQLGFDSTSSTLEETSPDGLADVFQRSNPLAPRNKSNNWWIPAESGWGLTVFDQGSVLAPTWFTYDTDGEPTWFIMGGAFPQSDGSFRGDLFRFTGTRYDQIVGAASTSATPIGNATLRYGDDALEFEYTALGVTQTKSLERFPFGPRSFSCTASPTASRDRATNYTDGWTGGGWGLTVFHIDTNIFAIWYTYDLDGEATFFVVQTALQADGSFAGQAFKPRSGTPFLQIDGARPSSGSDPAGSASFRFSDGDTGTFTHNVGGVTRTHAITRLVIGSRPAECVTEPYEQ